MSHEPEKDDVVFVGATGRSDRPRRIAIGVAVAVVAMLGGAVVAFAAANATPSSTPKPSSRSAPNQCPNSAPQCVFDRPFGVRPPGAIPGLGFPADVVGTVHGQVVVVKPGGSYQTLDIQRGKVTAVGPSSISVRSADGFTASYTLTGSTDVDAHRDAIGSVKVGNQVVVLATVSGSTATSITDLTLLHSSHPAISYGWQSAG